MRRPFCPRPPHLPPPTRPGNLREACSYCTSAAAHPRRGLRGPTWTPAPPATPQALLRLRGPKSLTSSRLHPPTLPAWASALWASSAPSSSPLTSALPGRIPLTLLAFSGHGPRPQPSITVRKPRMQRTLRQTDAPACPSGSFSLPHVLRALRRDADPTAREGRSFRPGLEQHGAPVTARGADGDRAAEGAGAALPLALQPGRLPLWLVAHHPR